MAVVFGDFDAGSGEERPDDGGRMAAGTALAGWPDAAVRKAVVERRRAMELAELAWLGAVAEFDRRGLASSDGAASTSAWLRQRCRMRAATASSAVRTARQLDRLTGLEQAWVRGEVTADHVWLIARTAARAGAGDDVSEAEAALVRLASRVQPDDLKPALDRWRDLLDDDAGDDADGTDDDAGDDLSDEEIEDWARRRLFVSTGLDGTTLLDGELDQLGGARFRAVLERFWRMEVNADGEVDDAARRTGGQQRADALVAMAEAAGRWLDRGRGDLTTPAWTVVVDREALADRRTESHSGPSASDDETGAPGPDRGAKGWSGRGRCEVDGMPVSPAVARLAACDSAISVLLADGVEPLALGRSRRLASRSQRLALLVRDAGCVFAGCDRPARWCVAHHLVPWDLGGATDLDNLVLLCRHHHTLVHAGWRLRRRADGGWDTHRPDGGLAGTRPPPTGPDPPRPPPS